MLHFCRNGEVDKLAWLLRSRWSHSLDVNASLNDGWTALHYSADRADAHGSSIVQLLLSRGSTVDALTRTGVTPLMLAVDARNRASVKALLEAGADPDILTERGMTALHMAAKRGEVVLTRWLLTMGANVRLATRTGRTALHDAAAAGACRVASVLIDAGAHVNAVEHVQGDSPLHVAVRAGHADMSELLLTRGASLLTVNVLRETPVQTAVRHDRFVLAAALPRMLARHRRWWLLRLLQLLSMGRASMKRHRALLERFELLSRRCISDGQLHSSGRSSDAAAAATAASAPPMRLREEGGDEQDEDPVDEEEAEVATLRIGGRGVSRSASCPIPTSLHAGADGAIVTAAVVENKFTVAELASWGAGTITTAEVCHVVVQLSRMPPYVWEVTLGFL